MKALPLVIAAAVAGSLLGVAMAYVSVGPAIGPQLPNITDSNAADSAALGDGPDKIAAPRVKVDNLTHDFGVMQRGSTESHEFTIENVGDGPLRITVGDTSCKCTVGEVEDGEIPPGQSTPVKLEWVARVLAGDFRQTANLLTNDPLQSQLVLTVEGQVVEATGLEPQDFNFGRVSVDKAASAKVTLLSYDQTDLEVTAEAPEGRVDSESEYTVDVTPIAKQDLPDKKAKAGVSIKLTATPGMPIGRIHDWVSIETNLPTLSEFEVPVFGRVEGDLTIHGRGWNPELGVLNLGMVKGNVGKSSKLRVSLKGDAATLPLDEIKLKVVETDPQELEIDLGDPREVREGVVHVPLEVSVPVGTRPMVRLNSGGQKPDGTFRHPDGIVRLKGENAQIPEIELKVRFAVE